MINEIENMYLFFIKDILSREYFKLAIYRKVISISLSGKMKVTFEMSHYLCELSTEQNEPILQCTWRHI